ncbi:hypothetical protein [Neobacillus sp. LXY-4]|uniref:hypothetical protein n=1 Tax=Neobacillus sp. LXY-4 TaxID=3379826 RepID=UPI003EDE82C2
MSLKKLLLINITMILFSWLSLAFFGKRNIKKFLPASIFIFILEAFNAQIGKKRKWWVNYNNPKSYFSGEFPMNIGPFLVGTMWILKKSFGDFKKFILINASLNAFFAFVLAKVTEKLKVVKLVRLNEFQFFLFMFYKAFLLYGFQYLFERNKA